MSSMTYISGKKEGVLLEYYEDGSIKKEVLHHQDKKEGLSKTYFPNGQLHLEMNYISGKPQGTPLKFDEHGNSMMTETYENIEMIRVQEGVQLSAAELQNISRANKIRNVQAQQREQSPEQRKNEFTKNENFWK